MALPALADVRRSLPAGDSLAIAARPSIAPLFDLLPGFADVVVFESRGRLSGSFARAILLPNSFQSALTAWRSGIPERCGYRTDWRGAFLTRAIDPPTEKLHQVEYYRRLVRSLDISNGPGVPRIELAPDVAASGADQLRGVGWNGEDPLVAIAPGAAYGGSKRWPPEYFAELVRSLAEDGVRVVMVGGRGDLPVGREIEQALESKPSVTLFNLMGTDLSTLAAVLVNCRAVVSNDSGAMHLAVALGVHVTAVYGPTDEQMTRPLGDGHAVLTNAVWCRPCWLRECPIDHRCMRGIPADRVGAAVRQML
jgi:heptosyltransferase-2